ncbi:hypothetical protein LB506_007099 [Fusarium annulatum]|nr:hypothetical protein LB506_007099 [Fusarium annulatum]
MVGFEQELRDIEMAEQKKSRKTAKGNSGTGNRTLGSAELISQVMRARNVSHYTIPDDAAYTSALSILV